MSKIKISSKKDQTVLDILHNLKIIRKKVKQNKFDQEQLQERG